MLRRVLRPASTPPPSPRSRSYISPSGEFDERAWATAWLEARESGRLDIPRDVHDAGGWDTYWTNNLEVGPADLAFSDAMSSDESLVALLVSRDARTVLCAGNGLSTEALSLALHGFDVTVLDLSAVAISTMAESLRDPGHRVNGVPGFRLTDDAIVFGDAGSIPPELCPKIHRSEAHPPRAGGSLRFAAGDLISTDLCPGPFDVVIERRTVQLFPEQERPVALERLVSRLAERGTFVSHHHDGRGRPGSARHYATEWVKAHGFVLDYQVDAGTRRSTSRLARLNLSTG